MRKTGVVPLAALTVFAFLSLAFAVYPGRSVASSPDKPAAAVVLADESAKTAGSAKDMAFRHKELGDGFRTQGKVARAAEEYDKALSLYDGFPVEDRLMMARFLSWGGKLDEAIRELNKILSEEPDNQGAQAHLARCLSWKKDQTASLALVDKSTKTAENARETAFRHKELGDGFRDRDEVERAAEEYDKALSLYDNFPLEDRFMMARNLSWGGKVDGAIRELNKILSEEPEHLKARIHLAYCLLWKGDQAASLAESSKALAASPGNKEALLVRANALRWSGDTKAGVSIYKEILEKEENFDARLGLSQVYLEDGDLPGAQKEAALLKPESSYQEKELANLLAEISKATTPDALKSDMPSVASAPAIVDENAMTAREKAFRHKELGDGFRERDEVARASEEYGKALSLHDGFPVEDRLVMARYLSWDGKLDEAILELRKILAEEPENLQARIHLARCLSWKGDQAASLEESSKALAASPENKEALLVRANALRWSGDQKAGVSVYKEILEKGEDFGTRLGLSQVYLSDGYLRGAQTEAALLKPEYPYQEKELANLRSDIDKATRPDAMADYSYYSDSDNNRAHRYTINGGFWTGYWKWGIGYIFTDAIGPGYSAQGHKVTLSTDSRPLEWLWIGGTVGYGRSEGDSTGDFFMGSARVGTNVYNGRLNFSVSRDGLTDTAELIDRRIRYTEFATNISHPLPYRFSMFASFALRDYSDDNRSMDVQGMIRHAFWWNNPVVSVGYRFRFLDFQRGSGGGYFDPSNYMSHRLDVAFDYSIEKMYANLTLYGGHQSFSRNNESASSFFGGWLAVLGRHVTDSIDVEIHGEGSDETGGSTSGFRYNDVGARIRVRF